MHDTPTGMVNTLWVGVEVPDWRGGSVFRWQQHGGCASVGFGDDPEFRLDVIVEGVSGEQAVPISQRVLVTGLVVIVDLAPVARKVPFEIVSYVENVVVHQISYALGDDQASRCKERGRREWLIRLG